MTTTNTDVRPVVALVAADPARRAGLAALLRALPVEIREHAGTAQVEEEPAPDALVLALASTERDAVAGVGALRERAPDRPILVVATPARQHDVRRLLEAGANGVVLDAEVAEALAPALRAVLSGQVCIPRESRRHATHPAFSHREKQILSLLVTGVTNRQIGDALYLTESTVKSHLASAFAKLGVRSRAEAAAVAEELGLVPRGTTGAAA